MSTNLRSAEPRRGSRRQPEASRNAILQAALAEFAQEGLAGARVDAIADNAGVNKALLYYYFHDKATLYGATLENFFAPLHQRVMEVCDRPDPAGERFLRYAREHFDSIAASPFPSLFRRSSCGPLAKRAVRPRWNSIEICESSFTAGPRMISAKTRCSRWSNAWFRAGPTTPSRFCE